MPPALLFDPSGIDHSRVLATREQVYEVLPHRHEFMLLDGVTHLERETRQAAAYHEVTPDEFWVKGHIPGRPIMPGVIIIEAAAQLASYATLTIIAKRQLFLGLGGVDRVKFRGAVEPGCRLILLTKLLELRSRKLKWGCQAIVDDRLVFEGEITGMEV